MPKVKLTYFDFPGGRGEDCRIALHMAGVDFEDDRIKGPVWAERKPSTPFGGLPVLEVEGRGTLAQSNTILRYIGVRHDLHPGDQWEAARHESVMNAVEDLRTKLTPVLGIKDEDEKKSARAEIASGYMQQWGANIEKQIGGPFLAGDRIHVADLKLFVVTKWFVGGGVDHIGPDVFENFPKLMGLFEAVKNHPKVVEWYAKA